ncbi:MAG: hypothetical protein HGA25_10710, partial [Clostridiales bacterium]|nr:hypothetical protein [Clostridiales bacterium]
ATSPIFGPTLFAWPPTVHLDLIGGDGFVGVTNTGTGSFAWDTQAITGQEWLSVLSSKAVSANGFSGTG